MSEHFEEFEHPKIDLVEYLNRNLSSYGLTAEQAEWIERYLEKSPDSLKLIVHEIGTIVSDGSINVQDIPFIVDCISTIYHDRAVLTEMMDIDHLIAFVKYTIDCMIDSDTIVAHFFEKKTLKFFVDASLDVLKFKFPTTIPAPSPEPVLSDIEEIIDTLSAVDVPTPVLDAVHDILDTLSVPDIVPVPVLNPPADITNTPPEVVAPVESELVEPVAEVANKQSTTNPEITEQKTCCIGYWGFLHF
jgi:hypothetical protein